MYRCINSSIIYKVFQNLPTQPTRYLSGFVEAVAVGGVDDVYQDVGVFEVVPPVRPDPPLTPDVPHVQLEAGRLHAFYVEALGEL